MKDLTFRAALSLILAASLATPTGALAYSGLGSVTREERQVIGAGLELQKLGATDDSGRSQSAYILEYTPGMGTLPLVSCGETVWGKDRLGGLVDALESDGRTVQAAVNGDFYSMQTGVPMGVMISNGKLISSDDDPENPRFALGFTADGQAMIGLPQVKLTLERDGLEPLTVDYYNKYPTIWGSYLVASDFAATSMSTEESLELVLELEAPLTASGRVRGYVRDIIDGDCNSSIPAGCMILTVADASPKQEAFRSLAVGDSFELVTTCNPGWELVETAVGGGDLLLSGGELCDGIGDEAHETASNPRTAAGIRADGSVVFFAVDGRSSKSRGLKESELAEVMRELGCDDALNLDGGGSTTVMVKYAGDDDCVYINAPSDGSYRSISNGILLVSELASDGIPAVLTQREDSPLLLSYSGMTLTAEALDRAYMPTAALVTDLTLEAEAGTVDGSRFVAGSEAGSVHLKLSGRIGDETLTGDAFVEVTNQLDTLTVTPEFRRVKPGELAKIDLAATYKGRDVIVEPQSFYYTIDGEHIVPKPEDYPDAIIFCALGYIDKRGNFHSFAGVEGEVEIGVWYNQLVEYVTIKIGGGDDVLADLEDAAELGGFRVHTSEALSEVSLGLAREGYKSSGALELSYSFAASDFATLYEIKPTSETYISSGAASLSFWLAGDISGAMSAVVKTPDGRLYELPYHVTKDYSRQLGWRQLTAEIPAELSGKLLTLETALKAVDLGSGEHVIRLDRLAVSYGDEAPALSELGEHWAGETALKLYDMGVIGDEDLTEAPDGTKTYDLTASLTRGEFAKMLVRMLGLELDGYESGAIFESETDASLVPYIRCAIAHGLMKGYGESDGVTIFKASDPITREQVCTVLGVLLPEASANTLPFTDAASVSGWALPGVRACVHAGIVNGYSDATFRPSAVISRAEAITLLARV